MSALLKDALREALASVDRLKEENQSVKNEFDEASKEIRRIRHSAGDEIERLRAKLETAEGESSRLGKLVDAFLAARRARVSAALREEAAYEALDSERVPF